MNSIVTKPYSHLFIVHLVFNMSKTMIYGDITCSSSALRCVTFPKNLSYFVCFCYASSMHLPFIWVCVCLTVCLLYSCFCVFVRLVCLSIWHELAMGNSVLFLKTTQSLHHSGMVGIVGHFIGSCTLSGLFMFFQGFSPPSGAF